MAANVARSKRGAPAGRGRKNISDRGFRYRATANAPAGPRICHYCGSDRNVLVDHVDGREENSNGKNLIYACKSCNTAKGLAFRRAGRGRRISQTNPPYKAGDGAHSMEQWVTAVLSMRGESDAMTLDQAVEMIHATPESRRSKFAKQIWSKRTAGGAERGRREARREARRVPF